MKIRQPKSDLIVLVILIAIFVLVGSILIVPELIDSGIQPTLTESAESQPWAPFATRTLEPNKTSIRTEDVQDQTVTSASWDLQSLTKTPTYANPSMIIPTGTPDKSSTLTLEMPPTNKAPTSTPAMPPVDSSPPPTLHQTPTEILPPAIVSPPPTPLWAPTEIPPPVDVSPPPQ